ncbi:O-acyltransferase WSD1-like [Helianthus annuus]|nr:O-acyltransferase WSD1-like [Helianthus annuus]
MELKIKKLGPEEVDMSEPVSPTGQYFSIPPSVCIIAVFEFENPVDDSINFEGLIMDTIPRVNPRFTSIMVEDEKGEKYWKRVELKAEDHIIVPHFPDGLSTEAYDDIFADYISDTGMEPFLSTRPLWELHVFKYPTSNAPGTVFFKLHHALGDGYSLMGVLLSCLQRADNPSMPLTFPKFRLSPKPNIGLKSLIYNVTQVLNGLQNTVLDFSMSILKNTFFEDPQTPIRHGKEGVEFQPINVTTMTFSLDQVKKIKDRLEVTLNDVIAGVVFLGTRLYMESTTSESGNSSSTSLVLLNTRSIDGYKSVEEMLHNPDTQHLWGNQFGFIQVSIPKLYKSDHTFNPLKFVYEVHATVKRNRNSWAIHLTGMLLECLRKYRGTQVAAKFLHRIQKNASMGLTNMMGPVEKMAASNQPIKGLYVMIFNVPQSYKVTVMSYMNQLRVVLGTEKGVIDPQKLKKCILQAYDMINKASL